MKVCSKCRLEKPLSEFGARTDRPGGILSDCNACRREKTALYRAKNPDKIRAYSLKCRSEFPEKQLQAAARYRAKNPEKLLAYDRQRRAENGDALRARAVELYATNRASVSQRRKICRQLNAEKVRAKEKAKRRANPEKTKEKMRRDNRRKLSTIKGRLENRIRVGMLRGLIKGSKMGRRTFDLLGYSSDELKKHLEAQFLPGMSWGNFGPIWHVDHVVPLSVHNYETPDHADFKRAWALSNLQPLWSKINLIKGAKVSAPFQPSLAI